MAEKVKSKQDKEPVEKQVKTQEEKKAEQKALKQEEAKKEKSKQKQNELKKEESNQEESKQGESQVEEQVEDKDSAKEKKERKPRKDKKTQRIEELEDKLMRSMAEFENFRKRTDKEKSQMFEMGAKSILEKMLPVIDNFERGLNTVTEENKENAFVQGMEMTYKHFMTTMEELGVKPIEAVGKEFDPNVHNAVMHAEDESLGANMVVEELQKGYSYRDMILRYSMVKVVN